MKLDKAKTLFRAGAMLRADLVYMPMMKGYVARFEPGIDKVEAASRWVLETQRGGDRYFKNVDSGIKALKEIGFPDVWVRF